MLDDIIKVFLDFSSNADSVINGVTGKVDKLGDRLTSVGQSFAPISLGAAVALGGAAKLAIDFDKALQSAARGLDLSDTQVKEFATSMEKLQKDLQYQFASTELANIATEAGKLGVATDEIDDFTKIVTKLSVAVDKTDKIEDLSTNMAKIQTVFSLSVPEVEKFGAAMNKLDDVSSATADQILTFTQMAGKVGAAFKVNQNVLAAYGTTLVSAGAKAGEAANFMNKFLTVLAAPTVSSLPAQEAIEKLGYSVSDLGKRFDRDSKGTMEDFIKRLNKLDSVTRRDVMGRIFGLEHIDNASLLVAQADNLQKYLTMAGDSEGNIAKLNKEFSKMAENSFEGQFRTFTNLTGELGKQIGMVLLPGLNDILKTIQPILEKVVEFVQLHPEVSKYIAFGGLAVASIAPLLITLGGVVNAVTSIISIGGGLIGLLKGIGTIASIVLPTFSAGFVGIGGAILTAVSAFAPFFIAGAAVGALAAVIVNNWKPISGFFKNLFNEASNDLRKFGNDYQQVFTALSGYIGSLFTNARSQIQYYISGYSSIFSSLASYIGSAFTNIIAHAKYSGQMLIYNFIKGIESYAQSLINSVGSLMQTVRGYLPSSPAKYGALSDLDKTGEAFTNTFLQGVNRSPLSSFLNSAFTTPNATPALALPNGGGNGNVTIELNYSPTINGSKMDANAILSALKNDERSLQNLLNDAANKINRRYY